MELLAAAMAARGITNRSDAVDQAIREWGTARVEEGALRAADVARRLDELTEVMESEAEHQRETQEQQAERLIKVVRAQADRVAKVGSRNEWAAEMVYALLELAIPGIEKQGITRERARQRAAQNGAGRNDAE